MRSALSSSLYLLAKHPAVIQRVCAELSRAGISGNTAPGDLSFEEVQNLRYTSDVAKEVLRLMPPVGAGFRKASKTLEIEVGSEAN